MNQSTHREAARETKRGRGKTKKGQRKEDAFSEETESGRRNELFEKASRLFQCFESMKTSKKLSRRSLEFMNETNESI